MTQLYSRALLNQELINDEGLKLKAYRDTANPPRWTIGVGRNLTDVGIRPSEAQAMGITNASVMKNGITEPQAMQLLADDIMDREKGLDSRIPWWRNLCDARQRVLLNMAFQLGVDGLMAFVNTLNAIKQGAYATAADSMLKSKWAGQVPSRAERLAAMMRTGS